MSNNLERITLSNLTLMMSMVDPVDISLKTPKIDSECSLEKVFTKSIHMNPRMVLYLIVNQLDSCHGCIRGLLA